MERVTHHFFFLDHFTDSAVDTTGLVGAESRQSPALGAPLGAFFTVVTISLLPDFHNAGDYRYFALGCAHAVMVFDIFAPPSRQKWLPLLLGILPIVLVARGLINDASVLSFDLGHRFGFPLDHPNTAGFLLSMSFPLGLVVAVNGSAARRAIASVSLIAQALALVLTFSRGAWFGWGASMLFLGAATKKWRYCIGALVSRSRIYCRRARVARAGDNDNHQPADRSIDRRSGAGALRTHSNWVRQIRCLALAMAVAD